MHTAIHRHTLVAALLAAATAIPALASGAYLIVRAPMEPAWVEASTSPRALFGFELALDARSAPQRDCAAAQEASLASERGGPLLPKELL